MFRRLLLLAMLAGLWCVSGDAAAGIPGPAMYRCWLYPDAPETPVECQFIGFLNLGDRQPGIYQYPRGDGSGLGNRTRTASDQSSETETCSVEEPAAVTSRPVLISTGEKILPEADFAVGGMVPLGIGRNYYSGNDKLEAFGRNWSSTIDYGLIFEHAAGQCSASLSASTTCNTSASGLLKLYAKLPGGSIRPFTQEPTGEWVSDADWNHVLTQQGGGWLL